MDPEDRYEADKTDHDEYLRYTGKARLDLAMHTLEGLVAGVVADDKASTIEVAQLVHWLGRHAEFSKRHPFNEVIPVLQRIVADGKIDEEERADLLWLCNRFATEENYYDAVTSDMQRLQGFLAGVLSDGKITETELASLSAWIDDHEHLKQCWPYDEIEGLIIGVMRDGKIDAQEQRQLQHYFAEFACLPGHKTVRPLDPELTVAGVCAVAPEIEFAERFFCFTGASKKSNRNGLPVLFANAEATFTIICATIRTI